MRRNLIFIVLFLFLVTGISGQGPVLNNIRIADTLTTQEKINRNTVILRSELDSMINAHNIAHPVPVVREITSEVIPVWIWALIIVPLLIIAFLLMRLARRQKLFGRKMDETKKIILQNEFEQWYAQQKTPVEKNRIKTRDLQDELTRLTEENESLKELTVHYEELKKQISSSYKIRNYPGYQATSTEDELLEGLLKTERSVAAYSYEHFLKPIITIADANKNNPARISKKDQDKLMELLISLSLLYIEYLYLRVNELAVGGNMVARIQGLSNGNRLDTILMKQLNMEHGSRALVLRMILDKMDIKHLSYPVFDETNLNLS